MEKNVIFFVGRGKSTLTDFFLENNNQGFITIHIGRGGLTRSEQYQIRDNPGLRFVIHAEDNEFFDELPTTIKAKTIKFYLEY